MPENPDDVEVEIRPEDIKMDVFDLRVRAGSMSTKPPRPCA
jgi:protein subunit release factor A